MNRHYIDYLFLYRPCKVQLRSTVIHPGHLLKCQRYVYRARHLETWRLRYGCLVGWKAQHRTIVIKCLDIAIYGYRWYRYIHTMHFCHTMLSHLCMFAPGFLWWLGCRVTTCTPQRFRLGHLSSSFGATVPEWGHTFTMAFQGTRWCWRSTQRMSHTWLWREAPGVSCPKLIWFSLMV